VLKRLDDALRSGDSIRAIIRHTGVNQDGKTLGIALPNCQAQESLVREMYQQIKLDPRDVQYVEAHGTGTIAGDVTEMKSISAVFGQNRKPDRPLFVGSVKSNIGHLESSSGLAGLIKTILMLEKGLLAPNINLDRLKSGIENYMANIQVSRGSLPISEHV